MHQMIRFSWLCLDVGVHRRVCFLPERLVVYAFVLYLRLTWAYIHRCCGTLLP